MAHWHIATREQLVQHCNREQISGFAALFPVVLAAAENGDPLACEVLTAAGTELAHLARIVLRRLWPGSADVEIAITGGVFFHSTSIRQVFANIIRSERPEVHVRLSQRQPFQGALYLAQQAASHSAVG
jgi:N-acetylglucosamine kinase-like BadF-type ATPase